MTRPAPPTTPPTAPHPSASAAPPCARPAAPASPRLLVADQVAGLLSVLSLPDGAVTARLERRHLAEHAGFLALPRSRTAFVDDRAGELLILDPYGPDAGRPLVEARVPVAVPAEHIAADPQGRRIAVTTGLGRNGEAWSDQLTAIDLHAPGGPSAVRTRTLVGEPGVTVLGAPCADDRPHTADSPRTADASPATGHPLTTDGPLVVLRHREPGALTAHRHRDLMSAAPSCPPAEPLLRLGLADDDGHGDAQDPRTARLFAAAGSGVHRARRDGDTLVPEPTLPWAAAGRSGGRGYYLRLDPARRMLWSCVRGGPAEPGRWPEWTNDAWWHRLDGAHPAGPADGHTGRIGLGPGLVFRLAVAARHVAFARVHPDGDELVLVATDSPRPHVCARLPLPPMDGAPRRGGTPWDGVQRRAIAASPGGPLVAVTRGGHGEIHLFDADRAEAVGVLTVPTPLDEGGHLALITPDDGAHRDPVGR